MLKRLLLTTLLLTITSNLWAGCTPETVQFYLDKGFTQEQITKLCASSTNTAPAYQPYQKPVVIVQEGYGGNSYSAEERKAISELRGSISGRSVDITDTHINYITKVCIRAGNSPEKDQRIDKCIDVAFSIARHELRATDSGATLLLFGQQNVGVSSSDIQRKHVTADPWAAFSPDIRYLLKRKYDSFFLGVVFSEKKIRLPRKRQFN